MFAIVVNVLEAMEDVSVGMKSKKSQSLRE